MKTRQKIKVRERTDISRLSSNSAPRRTKSRTKKTKIQRDQLDQPINIPIRLSDRPHPRKRRKYFLTHAALTFLSLTMLIPLSAHVIDKSNLSSITQSSFPFIKRQQPSVSEHEDILAENPVPPVITQASFIFTPQRTTNKDIPSFKMAGKVFHWFDDKLKSHATNLHYHPNRGMVKMFDEIDTYQRITKIVIDGKQIFVPVTLKHQGRTVTVDMILDTGCTLTSIPYQYLERLKPENSKKIRFKLANGNTANGWLAEIDSIQVGTQETTQFELAGSRLTEKHEYGQLGMDFLRDHQFRIDMKNGQIIWM